MKKITLIVFMSLISFAGFAQLALEGFEGATFPPAGWGVFDNGAGTGVSWAKSPGGQTGLFPARTGTYAAFADQENVLSGVNEDWLITPVITVPANAELKFWSRLTQNGNQGTRYQIRVSQVITPGSEGVFANYTLLQEWTETQINPIQQQYTEKLLTLPAALPAGTQIRVAFVMVGINNGDRWLVDDVKLLSKCADPVSPTSANPRLTTVDLSWGNPSGATEWEIEVLPVAGTQTFRGVTYSGALPYRPVLLPDTDYKYYVRAKCSNGNESAWIGPHNFSTVVLGATCLDPLVIPTDNYSVTDNTSNYGDNIEGAPGTTGCNTTGTFLNGDEVVYSYTPTYTGVASISMTGNGANSGMFVYNSCANIGVSCVAGGTGSATAAVNLPSVSVTAGVTYYIVISTSGTTQSTPYTLTVQRVNCPAPTGLAIGSNGLTATSANLTWNANTATSWQVAVQPVGTGLPTSGTVTTVNTNYNVTRTTVGAGALLTPATSYEYYVRADCNNGTYSAWAGPFTFTTTQIPVIVNYTEDFESASPGWSLINGTQPNKWVIGTAVNNGGTKSLYISNNNGAANAYDIANLSTVHAFRDVEIPVGATNIGISFDWRNMGENTLDYLRVWAVPTDFNPVPGTLITPVANVRVDLTGVLSENNGFITSNYVFNAAAFGGQVRRFIFEWRNSVSGGVQPPAAVDNINITAIRCNMPTNVALTAAALTTTSAAITWTAPAVGTPASYDYYYSTTNTAPTATTPRSGNSTTTGATLSPLLPSTTYYVWVRSNCGGTDGTSFWTPAPLVFTTPQIPAQLNYVDGFEGPNVWTLVNGTQPNKWVIGTAVNNGGANSLYITNNNGAANAYTLTSASTTHAYRDVQIPAGLNEMEVSFDWRAVGEGTVADVLTVWLVPVTFVPTPGTLITAANGTQLSPSLSLNRSFVNATYTVQTGTINNQIRRLVFQWKNDGSLGAQTPAAIDNVNLRAVTCRKPQDLAVNTASITQTSAQLSWTEMNGATSWEIEVLPQGSPAPAYTATGDIVPGTLPTYPAAGLTPATTYWFYVRTNCGTANGKSSWAGPFEFTTLIANDECTNAIQAPVNNNSYCDVVTRGTLRGATQSPQPNTCTGTADDDVWFEFTATRTQHYIALLDTDGLDGRGMRVTTAGLRHSVYSGSCNNLTLVQCNTDNNSILNNLVVGQTYKIRVYSSVATPQTISFNLCIGIIQVCSEADAFCDANGIPGVRFDGSVGIPNLGARSCLSTTPNPTYFTLKVGQTGPIALDISQTNNLTGLGIDVDFIAYGPFTNALDACNGMIPANQVACSYSIAAIERFTIANAQAGQYYLVMITNFRGDRSTVSFTQTNSNTLGAGVTDCTGICEVDFGPDQVFCGVTQYTLDAQVVNANTYTWYLNDRIIPGATSQTYIATQTGNYKVVVTKRTCTTPPTDTISLTFGPEVNLPTPTAINVCGTGGSAQINLQNLISNVIGNLNPADYVVEFYNTEADATAGIVTPIDSSVLFTTGSQTIYVRVESAIAGICFDVVPLQIVVNTSSNATIAYAGSPFCSTATAGLVTLTGNAGGHYSAAPVAPGTGTIVINRDTGAINVSASTPGNYTVTYTIDATPSCAAFSTTAQVQIVAAPEATIAYLNSPYCGIGTADVTRTGTTGGVYSSTAGLVINATTGQIDLAASTEGTYTVSYTLTGTAPCSNVVKTAEVVITAPAVATIAYAGTPYCSGAGTAAVTHTGTLDGVYASTTGLEINQETGLINLTTSVPGTYTVTYTIAATGGCPAVVANTSITITRAPKAGFTYSALTFCQNANVASPIFDLGAVAGAFTVDNAGLSIDALTGVITPSTSTPGTYVVTNTIPAANGCAVVTAQTTVEIIAAPIITFSYTGLDYCQDAALDPSPVLDGIAGTFGASPAGLSINSATGVIDLSDSQPGTYTVTNTLPATADCPEATAVTVVTINATPQFNLGGPYVACMADKVTIAVNAGNFDGNTATYAWTFNGAPIANITSTLQGTDFGTYAVTVTTAQGCVHTESVEVEKSTAVFNVDFNGECDGDIYTLEVLPIDDSFDPETAIISWTSSVAGFTADTQKVNIPIAGDYTVTIQTPEGCTIVQTHKVLSTSCLIQRGISPNGDGLNDSFDLTSVGVRSLGIFNRYGAEVYSHGAGYTNQWEGQGSNGDELPTGTYYYMIERADGNTTTGWIYINREEK